MRLRHAALALPLALASLAAAPATAEAFCGFYVGGAEDLLTISGSAGPAWE